MDHHIIEARVTTRIKKNQFCIQIYCGETSVCQIKQKITEAARIKQVNYTGMEITLTIAKRKEVAPITNDFQNQKSRKSIFYLES